MKLLKFLVTSKYYLDVLVREGYHSMVVAFQGKDDGPAGPWCEETKEQTSLVSELSANDGMGWEYVWSAKLKGIYILLETAGNPKFSQLCCSTLTDPPSSEPVMLLWERGEAAAAAARHYVNAGTIPSCASQLLSHPQRLQDPSSPSPGFKACI
jgi:hypothetical protein